MLIFKLFLYFILLLLLLVFLLTKLFYNQENPRQHDQSEMRSISLIYKYIADEDKDPNIKFVNKIAFVFFLILFSFFIGFCARGGFFYLLDFETFVLILSIGFFFFVLFNFFIFGWRKKIRWFKKLTQKGREGYAEVELVDIIWKIKECREKLSEVGAEMTKERLNANSVFKRKDIELLASKIKYILVCSDEVLRLVVFLQDLITNENLNMSNKAFLEQHVFLADAIFSMIRVLFLLHTDCVALFEEFDVFEKKYVFQWYLKLRSLFLIFIYLKDRTLRYKSFLLSSFFQYYELYLYKFGFYQDVQFKIYIDKDLFFEKKLIFEAKIRVRVYYNEETESVGYKIDNVYFFYFLVYCVKEARACFISEGEVDCKLICKRSCRLKVKERQISQNIEENFDLENFIVDLQ